MSALLTRAGLEYLGRFVEVDGNRIHYLEYGDGPPVLLMHGGGAGCAIWLRQIENSSSDRSRSSCFWIVRPNCVRSPFRWKFVSVHERVYGRGGSRHCGCCWVVAWCADGNRCGYRKSGMGSEAGSYRFGGDGQRVSAFVQAR